MTFSDAERLWQPVFHRGMVDAAEEDLAITVTPPYDETLNDDSDPDTPFFSILLPTKNRAEILTGAICSVRWGSFANWELVITDNDDELGKTHHVATWFSGQDPRIHYHRTGGLAMHDNWEVALEQARGRYVLVLEDKMRLVPNALELLHQAIRFAPQKVISYRVDFTSKDNLPAAGTPNMETLDSTHLIHCFQNFRLKFFWAMPGGVNSVAPREFLMQLKAKSPTGMLFSHLSPDYASAFQILSEVACIRHLDAALAYIPNNWMWKSKYSTCRDTYKNGALTQKHMQQLPFDYQEVMDRVPVKVPHLWVNGVVYDYLTKYREHRSILTEVILKRPMAPPPNWTAYHAFCLFVVALGIKSGANMWPVAKEIWKSMAKQGPRFVARTLWCFAGICIEQLRRKK